MYQYQLTFGEAVTKAFSNYCNFSGRAARSEYWWFMLFGCCLSAAISILFCWSDTLTYLATGALSLFLFLPSFGLLFRRLHDTGRSGWWWLIGFIPLVGSIILLVWCLQPSQAGQNQYGPEPNIRG